MIKRFLTWFFSNQKENRKIICTDYDGSDYSLVDLLNKLRGEINLIQKEIENLKNENIELTNSLYECENRLECRIDSIHPVVYNIGTKLDDQNV